MSNRNHEPAPVERLEERTLMSATGLEACGELNADLAGHDSGCACGACQSVMTDAGELNEYTPGDLDDDHTDESGYELHALPEVDEALAQLVNEAQLGEDVAAQFDFWLSQTAGTSDGGISEALTASGVPVLNSNPSASKTLYLDFDGHFESKWGSYSNISSAAFDTDGNGSSISAAEVDRIKQIWARVAEDYAPFDINVTTVDPGSFANGQALRVVIGGSGQDWYGKGVGGVSYTGSFTSSVANVAYVFENNLGNGNAKYTAEAISHEAGHAFGLSHQAEWSGNTMTSSYSTGANGWAPIMGVGYYQQRTTWSNGKTSSGATQDDLSKLASVIGYRADDHGGTSGSATHLAVDANTGAFGGSGIIERNGEVDAFKITAGSGTLSISVAGLGDATNVDLQFKVYNASGNLIATADPSGSNNASLSIDVTAGDYFVHVSGGASYGSLGQYTVSGTAATSGDSGTGDDPVDNTVGPEITVLLGNTQLTDGQTGAINFGKVIAGQSGPSMTFTIRNDGDQPLSLTNLSVPAGFTIVDGLTGSLDAGATDTFTIRLDTSTAGVKSGQITITSNDADEAVFNFAVTGEVAAQAEIAVLVGNSSITDGQTSAVSFGKVTQGNTGPTVTFTVRNDGGSTLSLTSLTVPSGYTVIEGLTGSLAAGQSDTFTVRLDTGSTGVKTGEIAITTNDSNEAVFNFAVTGEVAATQADISVLVGNSSITDGQTSPVGFGKVTQGNTGPTVTFTVRNDGGSTLSLTSLTVPSGYTVIEGLTGSLAAGQSDTFTVRLDTGSTGVKSGEIVITSNDTDEAVFNFAVTGEVAATAADIAVLVGNSSIADGQTSAVSFGKVTQGNTGPTVTFTVRNDGGSTLSLTSLTVPTGYTVIEGLTGSLAAGQSDTFTVRLDTGSTGVKSGQITITSNDADEAVFNFAVTGEVAATAADISVLVGNSSITDGQTSAVSFGKVTQGNTGPTVTFTVRNDGGSTLSLTSLTVPTGYTVIEGLTGSLAAGQSDTFTVRLDTGSTGVKSGEVVITSNDADEAVFNFAVTGEVAATQADIAVLVGNTPISSGQSGVISFGTVGEGTTGTSITFTVRNDGGSPLSLTGLSVPAGFTVTEGLLGQLAAGESDTFTVRLDTSTVGAKSGQLVITSSDSDEAVFTIALSGEVSAKVFFQQQNRLEFDANTAGWFVDANGDRVTVSISGSGSGRIVLDADGNASRIEFTGTDRHTRATIDTDGAGDNKTVVGTIYVDGSMRTLNAPTTTLTGELLVTGRIHQVTLDSGADTGTGDTTGDTTDQNTKTKGRKWFTLAATTENTADTSSSDSTSAAADTATDDGVKDDAPGKHRGWMIGRGGAFAHRGMQRAF